MQFLAYFDPSSGFYFACDDTHDYTKDIYWSKGVSPAGNYTVNTEYFPAGTPTDSVTLPYNVIIGATQGDWYAPAEMYRSWAVQQQWTQQSRTKQVSAWLHDLSFIRPTCAHFCGVQPDQPYSTAVQEWQQSQIRRPSAPGIGGMGTIRRICIRRLLSPQEGWASFDAMIHAIPTGRYYFEPSALYLDTGTSLYKSGTRMASAMLDPAGNTLTQPGAAFVKGDTWALMDVSTDPWRQCIVGVYQTFAQHGVDLTSFDSSMEAGQLPCYNPAHSHPAGMGGNWQTQAWIDLIQRTTAAVAPAPGFVGLVQVNFYVPDLPSGEYPIQVTIGGTQSNTPVISVRN
jgi:hypothetical protein